jgi:uncharacterized protein YciI
MPLFVMTCLDHEGALDRRMAVREAHLAWVRERLSMVKLAGPFLSEAGEMVGSMFILEAEDRAAVEAFAADDPYGRAGLFRSVEIRPWRVTIGALP